jgi:hypothetical protein
MSKSITLLVFFSLHFSSTNAMFSMLAEMAGKANHYLNKWYNLEYRQKHITSQDSYKIANDLQRIAIEGTAERALDNKTAEDLSRFNERCYLESELVVALLKKGDHKSIKELYENTPHQQLNIIIQLFMLKSLIQRKQELSENAEEINTIITKKSSAPKTPVQIAQENKRTLLNQLVQARNHEEKTLLAKFLENTTPSEKNDEPLDTKITNYLNNLDVEKHAPCKNIIEELLLTIVQEKMNDDSPTNANLALTLCPCGTKKLFISCHGAKKENNLENIATQPSQNQNVKPLPAIPPKPSQNPTINKDPAYEKNSPQENYEKQINNAISKPDTQPQQ